MAKSQITTETFVRCLAKPGITMKQASVELGITSSAIHTRRANLVKKGVRIPTLAGGKSKVDVDGLNALLDSLTNPAPVTTSKKK